jgi:hypothetical protein
LILSRLCSDIIFGKIEQQKVKQEPARDRSVKTCLLLVNCHHVSGKVAISNGIPVCGPQIAKQAITEPTHSAAPKAIEALPRPEIFMHYSFPS